VSEDSLVIYEEQMEKIDSAVQWMIKKAEAKCALLVDKNGHLIARQGFTQSLDTTALAALLAGSFASTREIARLVGEPEFSVLFHQGKKDHIHISLVNDATILAVIFDDRTTIGMVRLYSREASDKLNEIFAEPPASEERATIDSEFTRTAESRIDDIFGG
jgi:predicted regulator of Ras-like GTPase activity (Roadblock/LC7/MglB family)